MSLETEVGADMIVYSGNVCIAVLLSRESVAVDQHTVTLARTFSFTE